ncbi:methylated-DNA--[protein]-cysteine S-methyltransferase [Alloprevotella tannerae]|jgi:methylated-DNA--[protein]-cysteine S-methyltransferase|uniref:methylated-DNA--[protein]-cysteine S-methyltransferase n=1 Tax=Alloprevotella tannerae TaxID=76122 RepID=UPI00241D84F3|nr:methylated-DNA--[protein]-cysteine S-methyltransferase [Alloprevotella tannerae]
MTSRFYATYTSPLGEIQIESDGVVLTALDFRESRGDAADKSHSDSETLLLRDDKSLSSGDKAGLHIFDEVKTWLNEYFSGCQPRHTPRFRLSGTPFQLIVWEELQKIAYGETATYGQLAEVVAVRRGKAKMSAQAVGNALHKNPISLVVPCHRIIGSGGQLVGYGGGLQRKEALLALEQGRASWLDGCKIRSVPNVR